MKRAGLAASAVLIAVIAGGCSGGGGANKVVAKVNADTITEGDFFDRVQNVTAVELQNALNPQGPPSAGKAGEYAMHNLILEKLINQVATEKKLVPTDAEVNSYVAFAKKYRDPFLPADPFRDDAGWHRQAKLSLEFRKMALAQSSVKDSDLHAKFEQIKPQLKEQDQYHLRVVDCDGKQKADEALQALKKGMAFETVALTKSDDKVSAARMGDIGTVPEPMIRQQMPHLADAIKGLKKNEYTPAVITENLPPRGVPAGTPNQPTKPRYFLAQVVDKTEGHMATEPEVKFLLEFLVLQEKDPGALQRTQSQLADYRNKAKIDISLKGYEHLMDKFKTPTTPARPTGAPSAATPPAGAPR